jgi:DNA-binding GntR family transcriptional regulator
LAPTARRPGEERAIAETTIPPLDRNGSASAAEGLQAHLRQLILEGQLAPGSVISQVELASALGVSRTPLREAMRMLQEEGLIEAEPNRRARVTRFDPRELDVVYGCRIMLETLAVVLSANVVDDTVMEALEVQLAAMREVAAAGGATLDWQRQHRAFHALLVGGAPDQLVRTIGAYGDRAERYWLMLTRAEPAVHSMRDAEHAAILEAFRERDGAEAARRLARHLARTALMLLAQLAPEHEPTAVRTALQLTSGPAAAGRS